MKYDGDMDSKKKYLPGLISIEELKKRIEEAEKKSKENVENIALAKKELKAVEKEMSDDKNEKKVMKQLLIENGYLNKKFLEYIE